MRKVSLLTRKERRGWMRGGIWFSYMYNIPKFSPKVLFLYLCLISLFFLPSLPLPSSICLSVLSHFAQPLSLTPPTPLPSLHSVPLPLYVCLSLVSLYLSLLNPFHPTTPTSPFPLPMISLSIGVWYRSIQMTLAAATGRRQTCLVRLIVTQHNTRTTHHNTLIFLPPPLSA